MKSWPTSRWKSARKPPCGFVERYRRPRLHRRNEEWYAIFDAAQKVFAAGGNPHPQPLAIWHGSNLAEPETAGDYIEMYGALWRRRPDSLAFVRWLFNHPKVMIERTAAMDCRESLLWEPDFQTRGRILHREHEVLASIDDRLSAALVVKRQDRRCQALYPWMLAFGA